MNSASDWTKTLGWTMWNSTICFISGSNRSKSSNPVRLQKISMINGVIPIPEWKSNELAWNERHCAKNEKLNKICNKNTNKKGLTKLISFNSVDHKMIVL